MFLSSNLYVCLCPPPYLPKGHSLFPWSFSCLCPPPSNFLLTPLTSCPGHLNRYTGSLKILYFLGYISSTNQARGFDIVFVLVPSLELSISQCVLMSYQWDNLCGNALYSWFFSFQCSIMRCALKKNYTDSILFSFTKFTAISIYENL